MNCALNNIMCNDFIPEYIFVLEFGLMLAEIIVSTDDPFEYRLVGHEIQLVAKIWLRD